MADTHTVDTVLTKDEENLFSLSYRGFSGRLEMFCMAGWYLFLKAALKFGLSGLVAAGLLSTQSGFVLRFGFLTLFFLLFAMPLFVRRARQMGATWYGLLAIVLHGVPVAGAVWGARYADVVACCVLVTLLASLPLYLYGGTFSGKKNALMRAAMAGDMMRVRALAEDEPDAVAERSERGFTARDYALRMGHVEIAEYLRKAEIDDEERS